MIRPPIGSSVAVADGASTLPFVDSSALANAIPIRKAMPPNAAPPAIAVCCLALATIATPSAARSNPISRTPRTVGDAPRP